MIDYQLRNCCKECKNTEIDARTLHADTDDYVVICCEHQNVCKRFLDEKETKE